MNSEPETATTNQPFQAEVAQLLKLMVHSVYSETEIFLRELVSNASDACDKLRYEAISKPELLGDAGPLAIQIITDKNSGTLTITDSGIGMSREELVDNLGTIARSGTKAFVNQLGEAKDGAGLIGQFGVGFYSAFMVADRIDVISRRAGSNDVWLWQSTGDAGFGISPATDEQGSQVKRGTEIILHLKSDAKDYFEPHTIERVVRLYSDHVQFPIELLDANGEKRQINSASALWQRSKSELKDTDYEEAYRTLAHAFDKPAVTLHYKAEGRQAYAVLLFVPTQPPFDLFDQGRKGHVKLYVRRVYITDDTELLPAYLRFVRGVIDSEDLPLNISREMLQNNPHVAAIRNAVIGRVLTELERLSDKDPETFGKVWDAFGAVIKEGIYEDTERRKQLLSLARFTSSTSGNARSLKQYVDDLKPNQTEIYYLIGESKEQLRSNPALEAARARGIEVLFLTDHVDAFWTTVPLDFDGRPLKSLSQGDVNFDSVPVLEEHAEKESDAPPSTAIDDAVVLAAVKAAVGEHVSDVRGSKRLTESPACLVAEQAGPDRRLERILARNNPAPTPKPILELNMKHRLVRAIAQAKAHGQEADAADLALLLFEEAQILDGEVPIDPAAFTQRLNRLVMRGLDFTKPSGDC
ncbi:MAG TPA: molecular chaperone HtpG [Hyphomicrobiaceae bacterium]|nr:molecular chaperone HtpG [Hyphomicrobiaceae bacterium]